jgi:formate/nitrite transporter FocA (FNT family)
MLYLMRRHPATGVSVLNLLAWLDGWPGVIRARIPPNWGKVSIGNLLGALTVALIMAINFTNGFMTEVSEVGQTVASVGEARTIGYKDNGLGGWVTLFIRGALCNWMVSLGVVDAMISTSVPGKVIAMWMPIMVFFFLGFEHSVVNMFLFPLGLILGGEYSIGDYLFWNEIPTVLGNLIGGIALTGLTLYSTHVRTSPKRDLGESATVTK